MKINIIFENQRKTAGGIGGWAVYFYASFEITDEITKIKYTHLDAIEKSLFEIFPLICPIGNIKVFVQPSKVGDIKEALAFITDKKIMGYFLGSQQK